MSEIDREIMDYAFKNNNIIIAMDLDFGEVLRYPQHPGAIILRLPYAFTSKEINERLREFFLSISEAPNRSRAAEYND